MTVLALPERDGRLADVETRTQRPVYELDLEAVTVRGCRGLDQVFEELAPVDAEAARGVVDIDPEHHPGVAIARFRKGDASPAPVHHRAARNVPAPDH